MRRVRREFRHRWDLRWLAPLGFENAYEIAIPLAFAEEHRLQTITDLARVAPSLKAGLGFEFIGRPDGLPGLASVYSLDFAEVLPMQQALKFQAIVEGQVDVIDVYTTDGRLIQHELRILEDDKGFFPPYEASFLVRGEVVSSRPEVPAALGILAGLFDAERMRGLNFRLQEGAESEEVVARDALREAGLIPYPPGSRDATGTQPAPTPANLTQPNRAPWIQGLLQRTLRHLGLCLVALALGCLVALPLALLLIRRDRWAEGIIRAIGMTQTIPSIALLAFFVPLLGIGIVPALTALWLYSLFPILRNAYTGLRDAGPEAVEAATAMGMTPWQTLTQIRLPLAAPVIMAGLRTAAVLSVGTATLAAFIGAGGLGEPIVTGLQLADTRMILSGAIPAAFLAIAVDALLAGLERLATPRFGTRSATAG